MSLADYPIRAVSHTDPDYPTLLKVVPGTPNSLFTRGTLSPLEKPCLGVVGSRKMTAYGGAVLEQFIPALVRIGITIVSGLAYGIDVTAQSIALANNGQCVAVLAGGLDSIYPARHHTTAESILEKHGALVSEYQNGVHPAKWHFPARNRVIAALSHVVLVVEAGEKSGSLITARYAADYGREVAAVPGDITREQARGCVRLLQDGAKPVATVEDILTLFQLPLPLAISSPLRPALTGSPSFIYDTIKRGTETTEALLAASGWSIQKLQTILSVLELDGYIRRKGYQWQITS